MNGRAPGIVPSDGSAQLLGSEKEIGADAVLGIVARAAELIAKRRAQRLQEPASDRERVKVRKEVERREAEERAKTKAEGERKQREVEQERERRKRMERQAKQAAERERELQKRAQRQAEQAKVARKRALLTRIRDALDSDFLSADEIFAADPDAELISNEEYGDLKVRFVQDWASGILRQPLDSEQAAAVATIGGDIQVVARAGSGKTRTLITRAIFLQKHCRVSPRTLLLLAFNKKAAEEMKDRLAQALGEELPHVMTFHALAYAFVRPEEDLVFDEASTDQLGRSREVQEVIDEHVRSEGYRDRIRKLMLAYFREDWERIVDGRFQLTMDEFLAHRRALPRESLKGDSVKSFGEKVIANALFEHGVEYRYECNFRWSGVNYRPDFTIPTGPKGGLVIEYFGLQGDTDYDAMSHRKRRFWSERNEWTFLEFSPGDLTGAGVDGFVRLLLGKLQEAGVPWGRRSEEEIWGLIRRRALDRFTEAMGTFVGRCRKRNLSPRDLESMVGTHSPCSTAEALFLGVGVSVYRCYLQRLTAGKKEDFDGLMWHAVSLVREGRTQFARDKGRERGDVARLRFVMIDEFQDFSQMFFELVNAIRSVNPDVEFFCVGDDWQAINGFAGSDLRFFTDFARYFRCTSKRYVRTNYRSPPLVVGVGNALMHGRGTEAKPERRNPGWVRLCKLDEFSPSAAEQARHNGDEITPAILRLIRSFLDRGSDVVMLSRRNGVPWYINYGKATASTSDELQRFKEHIRSHLPKADRSRVDVSTTHKYKGRECSAVIVLDALETSYPLIHPNWVFLRVFGNRIGAIEDEERRLFYVAITRSKDSLGLVTETPTESPYLSDIRRHTRLNSLIWADLPPAPSLDGVRLVIRVFDAYDMRDHLKDLGYRWNRAQKCWHRAVLAEGFSFGALLEQPWARNGLRVEVYSEKGELLHQR